MQTKAILITTLLLAMVCPAQSQVNADAGPLRFSCAAWNMDTIAIGGEPTASGGVPPYTYTWEAEYSWSTPHQTFHFSASYFLNDTTIANPKVIEAMGDTIQFRLTVTDSENNTATDITNVIFAYFFTHLAYMTYWIDQGDSIFLYGWQNIFGGFPPYEYLWRPNHGLTDSTSLAFWAKPDYSVAYYMTLTDSAGCVVTGAPVYYVNVKPLNVEEPDGQKSLVTAYPNPVTDYLNFQIHPEIPGEFTLRIFLPNGKALEEKRFHQNDFQFDFTSYPTGIYLYEIINKQGFQQTGRIMVK